MEPTRAGAEAAQQRLARIELAATLASTEALPARSTAMAVETASWI